MTFNVTWRLTIKTSNAATLEQALLPETDPEHATMKVEEDRLIVEGQGAPGACQHALDDILACLTGAMAALQNG